MITQTNNQNMNPGSTTPLVIHVSQYDEGSRTLVFKLFAGSQPYTIPAGASAKISGTKPDGTCFSYPMTISGSTVSVVLQDQMTVLPGNVLCEITIVDSDGTASSGNFILDVERAPFDAGSISTTDIPILQRFVLGGLNGQVFISNGSGSGSWGDLPDEAIWGNITGNLSDQTDLQNALNSKLNSTSVGAVNGVASLDSAGKVPSGELPSYVDDVLEYNDVASFPSTGEAGKIYVAKDTGFTYRWSGTVYVKIGNPVEFDAVPTENSANAVMSGGLYNEFVRVNGDIAITEISPAQAAHTAGDFILYNGLLHLVTAAIAIGDTLTVGTNIALDTVGNELTFLRNAVVSGEIYTDWSVIANMVASGYGPMFYPVGTKFLVSHSSYGSGILFQVVQHITPDSDAKHKAMLPAGKQYGMVLMMDKVIYSTEFDQTEAFYYAENGLIADTYNVTITRQPWYTADVGKTFQFTLASDVPAGGVLCWGNYNASREGKNVTVYASRSATSSSQTAVMTEGNGGTALGDVDGTGLFNIIDRSLLGSNDYEESGIRQWLNANVASNWWTPKTNWDRIPSYSARPGFLYGFPQAFKDAILTTTCANRSNEVYDSHGIKQAYSTTEKMFLVAQEEVGFSSESSIVCGKVFDYYASATNTDRIKYDISNGTSARYWWLRTPDPSSASHERVVSSDGSQSSTNSSYGVGAVAACVIG